MVTDCIARCTMPLTMLSAISVASSCSVSRRFSASLDAPACATRSSSSFARASASFFSRSEKRDSRSDFEVASTCAAEMAASRAASTSASFCFKASRSVRNCSEALAPLARSAAETATSAPTGRRRLHATSATKDVPRTLASRLWDASSLDFKALAHGMDMEPSGVAVGHFVASLIVQTTRLTPASAASGSG